MFPCSDWATTPILENISDFLGDIEKVKIRQINVRNGIMVYLEACLLTLSVLSLVTTLASRSEDV